MEVELQGAGIRRGYVHGGSRAAGGVSEGKIRLLQPLTGQGAKSVRSARGVSGGAVHQDEMGGGRGEDGATYRCRVNGVAGERREEGARKRPTRRHCAVRML